MKFDGTVEFRGKTYGWRKSSRYKNFIHLWTEKRTYKGMLDTSKPSWSEFTHKEQLLSEQEFLEIKQSLKLLSHEA